MTGWISLDRDVIDHPLFKSEPARLGGWVWMITKAAWRSTRHDIAGRIVTIERGQICVSQRTLSDELGWTLRSTQRFLQRLESLAMIRLETASGRSIITICNYDKYQGGSHEPASEARQERVTKEQENKQTRDNNKHPTTDSRANPEQQPKIEPDPKPRPKSVSTPKPAQPSTAANPKFVSFIRATGMLDFPPDLPKMMDKWLNLGFDWDSDLLPIIEKTADQFRHDTGKTAFRAAFFDDAIRQEVQEHHDFMRKIDQRKAEREYQEKQRRDERIIEACEQIFLARDWLAYDQNFPGRPKEEVLKAKEKSGIEELIHFNLDPERTFERFVKTKPFRPGEGPV